MDEKTQPIKLDTPEGRTWVMEKIKYHEKMMDHFKKIMRQLVKDNGFSPLEIDCAEQLPKETDQV